MTHKESEMTVQFSLNHLISDDILVTSQVFKMMTYQVSQKSIPRSCLRKHKTQKRTSKMNLNYYILKITKESA